MEARAYQAWMLGQIPRVWAQGGSPLAVLPTGAGKSFIMARLIRDHDGPAVAVAHRRELVGQISLALARDGVTHRIVAPPGTIRSIVRANTEEVGKPYYSPNSRVAVAGVDSIPNSPAPWRATVTLVEIDEGHHVLRENKWGRAMGLFPHAKLLGVTATPERADGRGLGLHAEGLFTAIVTGPLMRELISAGYLSDYRIIAPPSHLNLEGVERSRATGDWMHSQLRTAVHKAQITGDIVHHYLKYAAGKLGVTFAVDVAAAQEIANAFNAAGVPAVAVHAKTPGSERVDAIRRFVRREILQLVNVDLFGEGFDLPAIEAVSFARPTRSWPLYCQSFGRALRPMPGKQYAIIIDHVGNIAGPYGHGLPDRPREHTLDSRERRSAERDPFGLKACQRCMGVYERFHYRCPYCGETPSVSQRSAPEFVDGDLVELDAETLARMRGEAERVDMPSDLYAKELHRRGCPEIGIRANVKRHEAKQAAQERLRTAMAWWRGIQVEQGYSERQSYRVFYLTFGIDALSARALQEKEADALCRRITQGLPFAAKVMA